MPIFTPGPWNILPDSPPAIRDSLGNNVCPEVTHLSDARLIAAAPDMHALLQQIIHFKEWETIEFHRARKNALAIIRKINGE